MVIVKHNEKWQACIENMHKWFGRYLGRYVVLHLLHDASIDSSLNEAFQQYQCTMTWESYGGSYFTSYTTYVAPSYKSIFFGK